jgi:IS6 family transposase
MELGQINDLNDLVEQDHRLIKRWSKPAVGFFSSETANRTLQGYEVMNMICKEQIQKVDKGDIRRRISFITHLFGVVA